MKINRNIFYHIIILFILGGLLGYLFETIFYFIKYGNLINKSGLWFTPLKPIYGLGLILISVFYKFKNIHPIWVFILGFILGSFYEYIASIFQEYILHTSTWNYNKMNNNLNGRITLSYSCIWAIFTYIWIIYGFNIYLKLYNKIINYKYILIILAIFLFIDISLTSVITKRYSERKRGIDASNIIEIYIDKYVNNKVFEEKFPNLKVKT